MLWGLVRFFTPAEDRGFNTSPHVVSVEVAVSGSQAEQKLFFIVLSSTFTSFIIILFAVSVFAALFDRLDFGCTLLLLSVAS